MNGKSGGKCKDRTDCYINKYTGGGKINRQLNHVADPEGARLQKKIIKKKLMVIV
jgi:hypothetical protein